MPDPDSQHVYIDESGRPEVFGKDGHSLLASKGTPNYLVIAAIRTPHPWLLGDALAKVAPLKAGTTAPRALHAQDDSRGRRRIVCDALGQVDAIATAIVMDKRLLIPGGAWERKPVEFYNDLLALGLSDSLHLRARTVVTVSHKDHDTTKDMDLMSEAIHARHEVILSRMASYRSHAILIRQRSYQNSRGLQAADYVAYAVFQAFEHHNMDLHDRLRPILGRVWDLSRLTSYTRKNPLVTPP